MYKDMIDTIGYVKQADPELGEAMDRELGRQRQNIELIASENIVSPAVMAAWGAPWPPVWPGRPPDPWLPREHERQKLQLRLLRRLH